MLNFFGSSLRKFIISRETNQFPMVFDNLEIYLMDNILRKF